MKTENERILQYVGALDQCKDVTGFPGMIIAIAKRKMSEEIEEYVKEQQKIFEKYGKRQEDGWMIPKDSPDFKKAMEEIMQIATYQTEVNIPQFSEDEFVQKFQSDSLNAENYGWLYEIFVKKGSEENGSKK